MENSFQKKFQISIIGSGNIAWHISHAFVKAGHTINQVYSRNKITAKELAHGCNAEFNPSLDFSKTTSQIFVLAVPDAAIMDVVSAIKLPPGSLLLSVSGSFPLQLLCKSWKRAAVMYPLQTFTKKTNLDFSEIPILFEAFDPEVYLIIKELADSISKNVLEASSSTREKIHVAAVFASNFTNCMLSISKNILEKENVDFKILQPLVQETIRKAFTIGPNQSQTGPAARGDNHTLQKHLDLLRGEENFKNIYNQVSKQISKTVNNP
ncbi:MAG: F420-dependent NADP oxidoreductase [Bacteroidota bacterium]|nr:F420-dependent NADP oxidoreductase [Bacteroidota bacterium]